MWHTYGIARVRVSTTVDERLGRLADERLQEICTALDVAVDCRDR
jgi:mRNA-degrading endonuclease toxin of MazEF toxin-antitoxin module